MSNRRKPKMPTAEALDEILADVRALPESSIDEVAMELSDVTHDLDQLDVAELVRIEGSDACRYGMEQLHKAVADLMSTYAALADAVGQVTSTAARAQF